MVLFEVLKIKGKERRDHRRVKRKIASTLGRQKKGKEKKAYRSPPNNYKEFASEYLENEPLGAEDHLSPLHFNDETHIEIKDITKIELLHQNQGIDEILNQIEKGQIFRFHVET